MKAVSHLNIVGLVGLLFTSVVYGSVGDELPEFQKCLRYCEVITCDKASEYPDLTPELYQNLMKDTALVQMFDKPPLNAHLTLLGWDCESNCDYQCQRIITLDRMEDNLEIHQFHGKWPFVRVFGIQELFSALFSIGNFIPNYRGYKLLKKQFDIQMRKSNYEFASLYFAYVLITISSMFAWFFSTIFHLKDTWNRERLDYFFAGLTVLTGFYAIIVRFFGLYKNEATLKRRLFGLVCIMMYVFHVVRLLHDWSYTYNMQANVIIGLVQNVLWVALAISQFKKVSNRKLQLAENLRNKEINWTLTPIALVLSVIFGMSFELFDFPPVFELIDAHAMWHFVTIWPQLYWYSYMVKDTQLLMERKYD